MPVAHTSEAAVAAVANDSAGNLQNLMERICDARRRSDALFSLVRPDALYERPIPERHRIIFYLGHLEAFDWNLLNESDSGLQLGLKSSHPEFDRLFAFGIDPVGGGLPTDLPSDWPALDAVGDYVAGVRYALDQKLDQKLEKTVAEADSHAGRFSTNTFLNVAVEHRLMHLETLAYMLHQLPLDKKLRPAGLSRPVGAPAGDTDFQQMVRVPGGAVHLGLARQALARQIRDFAWDNEYDAHTVNVPAFEIDQYKVTNRQYLEFTAAGGYEERAFWDEAGWSWKKAHEISRPLFWKSKEKEKENEDDRTFRNVFYQTMFDEIPFDQTLSWPVYVSHAEASAYARWAGKSLPTEAEWQRAADGSSASSANNNFARWDPVAVNSPSEGQSAFGVHGMFGNGWEWTSTVFAPFPGFEPFPFYRGYSADFFDGKHFVMKGGSARTAACMLRPTFRNWFQPHYQYVYAGFRCVSHSCVSHGGVSQ